MTAQYFKGLTWNHPRGYRALEAAEKMARPAGLRIRWERQPLEGFESHPIKDLCDDYDLIVLDHPHVGEAFELGCLQPIDALISLRELRDMADASVGSSLSSYQFAGHTWAFPLDAACQVQAVRPDLIRAKVPRTWDEVVDVAQREPTALLLAGPHAFLTLLSLAVSLTPSPDDMQLFDEHAGAQAYEMLRELHSLSIPGTEDKNPIEMLALMAGGDEVVLCPLIFGYVNFARPGGSENRLAFFNAPRLSRNRSPSSILGGTGIGISRRCKPSAQLVSHLVWLTSDRAQRKFIPKHDGQPFRRAAWTDADVNDNSNGFYANTLDSIETAHVRPQHSGFVKFQLQASEFVRQSLGSAGKAGKLVSRLNDLNRKIRAPREGILI